MEHGIFMLCLMCTYNHQLRSRLHEKY
jgi:hypothetical protein